VAERVDVVIAGAGIAGIAAAWQLAQRDDSLRIELIDPRPPLSLTSNRPEANYRDWWPQPAMAALADRSIRLMEELRADAADFAMDRRGYLYVTADKTRAAQLRAQVSARPPGVAQAEVLDALALRTHFPHLSPTLVAGLLVGRAGGIDTVALGRAILETSGASVVRRAVTTADIAAAQIFVNAAGPFAREVGRLVGADLPVETVLRQKVVIHDVGRVVPRGAPFTIALDGQGSRQGGVHVKPDDTGGPVALKLGWAWDQRPVKPSDSPHLPVEFPREVLAAASTFIPRLSRYGGEDVVVGAHEGGFYARTPDGRPLIGRMGPDRSFVIAGMAGFGAMMACGAAELLADVILGNADPGPFSPTRSMSTDASTGEL
jgi:glycine/D-amino acid oxidase-like deaminating enzyme